MRLVKKTGLLVFVSLLVACSDSEPVATVQQEHEANAGEKKDFLFKDMKDSMDAAKGVKNLMQKHHETQQQELKQQ